MEIKMEVEHYHKNEKEDKKYISFCDALGNNAITVGKADNDFLYISTGLIGEETVISIPNEDARKLAEFILSIL